MSNNRDEEEKTYLQYDELGFIIGMKRTEKSVNNIDGNVEKILKILNRLLEQQPVPAVRQRPQPKLSAYQQALNDANNIKPGNSIDLVRANPIIQAGIALDHAIRDIEDVIQEAQSSSNTSPGRAPAIASDVVEIDSPEAAQRHFGQRERDSKGRFIGAGGNKPDSIIAKAAENIGQAIKGTLGNSPQGVDPTIDAINEVAAVLSPVKRVVGFMLRPLTGFLKNRKRNEPIPKEQADHNKDQKKTDKEQNKLLKRISDRVGGGGLLGGLLKGGAGTLGLLARLFAPVLALGATFFGGYKLGEIVREKVGEWINTLQEADIPGRITASWDTFTSGLQNYFNEKLANTKDKAESVADFGASLVDKGLAALGNKEAQKRLKLREEGVIGHQSTATHNTSLGQVFGDATDALMRSETSKTNPKGIKRVVEVGNGYNIVELMDGSIIRQDGNFNWRNNNPGNIESGKFADSLGAIKPEKATNDKAKRFAVFPTYEAGRKAKEKLIFETSKYKNLDLLGAISRYAPPSENDTKKYQAKVLAAVNGQNKRMQDYSPTERKAIMNAMEVIEGYKVGKIQVIKPASEKPKDNKKTETPKNSKDLADFAQNATVPTSVKPVAPIANLSSLAAKENMSMLSSVSPVTNMATQTMTATASRYTPPKLQTQIEPVKQRLSSPDPQKVLVVNQGGDNISQNVGDRQIAHAITGGIGERSWKG